MGSLVMLGCASQPPRLPPPPLSIPVLPLASFAFFSVKQLVVQLEGKEPEGSNLGQILACCTQSPASAQCCAPGCHAPASQPCTSRQGATPVHMCPCAKPPHTDDQPCCPPRTDNHLETRWHLQGGLSPQPASAPRRRGALTPVTATEGLKGTAVAFYFRISMAFFNQQLILVKRGFIKKSIRKCIFSCR